MYYVQTLAIAEKGGSHLGSTGFGTKMLCTFAVAGGLPRLKRRCPAVPLQGLGRGDRGVGLESPTAAQQGGQQAERSHHRGEPGDRRPRPRAGPVCLSAVQPDGPSADVNPMCPHLLQALPLPAGESLLRAPHRPPSPAPRTRRRLPN